MSETNGAATYRIENGIAWLSFNCPEKRNGMSPTLNRRMGEILDEIEFRDDFGVLILKGEGTAWSAGMDLGERFREAEAQGLEGMRTAPRVSHVWWRRLRWYQKPTIAMVNGWCFGGGDGPLYACDLAVAADEAQFALTDINGGVLPGCAAPKVVVDLMPLRDAMYHAMTGELINGKKAAEWRLVNESVPLAQLEGRVTALAKLLLEQNPVALKSTKDAIRRGKEMTYDNAEARSDAGVVFGEAGLEALLVGELTAMAARPI